MTKEKYLLYNVVLLPIFVLKMLNSTIVHLFTHYQLPTVHSLQKYKKEPEIKSSEENNESDTMDLKRQNALLKSTDNVNQESDFVFLET